MDLNKIEKMNYYYGETHTYVEDVFDKSEKQKRLNSKERSEFTVPSHIPLKEGMVIEEWEERGKKYEVIVVNAHTAVKMM